MYVATHLLSNPAATEKRLVTIIRREQSFCDLEAFQTPLFEEEWIIIVLVQRLNQLMNQLFQVLKIRNEMSIIAGSMDQKNVANK